MVKVKAFILVLVLTTTAYAADTKWKRTWARKGAPVTKTLAVVLDTSGSMRLEPLQVAYEEVARVLSMFPDDGRLRVYTFASAVHEFEPEKGWKQLPDADLFDRLGAWLPAPDKVIGDTNLAAGVLAALANPEEDLTILLVTDGDPATPYSAHLVEIEKAQAKRKTPANIHVIGIEDWTWEARGAQKRFCEAVASRNGGSLLLLEKEHGEGPH